MSKEKRLDSPEDLPARSSAEDATAGVASPPNRKEARLHDDADQWLITLKDGKPCDARTAYASLNRLRRFRSERPELVEELYAYAKSGKKELESLSKTARKEFFADTNEKGFQLTLAVLLIGAETKAGVLTSIGEPCHHTPENKHIFDALKEQSEAIEEDFWQHMTREDGDDKSSGPLL